MPPAHRETGETFDDVSAAKERAVILSRHHPGQVFIVNSDAGRVFNAVNGDGEDGTP